MCVATSDWTRRESDSGRSKYVVIYVITKEADCCSAGIFGGATALQTYVQVFDEEQLGKMLSLASQGVQALIAKQQAVLGTLTLRQ